MNNNQVDNTKMLIDSMIGLSVVSTISSVIGWAAAKLIKKTSSK